jgi:hypothetical protein
LARFAVLITHREVLGRAPKLQELHAILKKYERKEVVFLLAKLNCILGTWQNEPQFETDEKLSNYLLKDFARDLARIRRGSGSRVVFSRFTMLYLMKQACLMSPEHGLQLNTREAHSDIGLCCLMANDLVLPFIPAPSDGVLERLTNLLPFSDYISHDHYSMEIGRTQIILRTVSSSLALSNRPDFLDVGALFSDRIGLDAGTFCELIFGCSSRFLNIKVEELEANPEAAVVRPSFFRKSKIPNKEVVQFFQKVAIPESAFVRRVEESRQRPANDLTLFQAFPLLEVTEGVFACLDPGFLVDKAGRSLYWTIFSQLEDDQRGRLASFWGAVFESYVNHLLEESYAAGGRFFPGPKFANGDEAFDGCILEGRDLVVFEYKSSVVRADAKYSGDAQKLKKELDLKFIDGDGDGAKGLGQIVKHVTRFFSGDNIADLSSTSVDRVYPVLVCLEPTMVIPYLGRYLNERFHSAFPNRNFRQVVTPLFTMGISDMENLLGHLQSFTFSSILESYHSRNRSMLTSISTSEVPLLRNKKPGRNIVKEQFSEFSETAIVHLFGDVPDH